MQAIIWIFFLLLIGLSLSLIWFTWAYGISPMPTSPKVKKALLHELPQTFSGTVYELGSGWGTLTFPLAEKYREAQVVGFEISWVPFLFSNLRLFFSHQKNLQFQRRDFFKEDLHQGNLFICYLYPAAMEKLKMKLPKGSVLVTHTFALPGLKPDRTVSVNDLYKTLIYFYKIN